MRNFIFFVALLLPLTPGTARADIVNEIFRVECIPELNVLSISDYSANGALPEYGLEHHAQDLAQKYGIYSYENNIITFEPDFTWQNSKSKEITCDLKTGKYPKSTKKSTYKVTLTGLFSNGNPGGRCGGWRTFEATVTVDGKTLIEEIPFSVSCNSINGISTLQILPHEGYARIEGTGVEYIVWFEKAPIRFCDVYTGQPNDPADCPPPSSKD
jgi:hypothetical protein